MAGGRGNQLRRGIALCIPTCTARASPHRTLIGTRESGCLVVDGPEDRRLRGYLEYQDIEIGGGGSICNQSSPCLLFKRTPTPGHQEV